MKVSIITVAFNNKIFMEHCIKSVLDQTYKNIEYIVVDGNSTDGTLEVVKRYEGKISKWISESDSGIYDAMNKGISMATGDIIGFLNSDDVYADKTVVEDVVDIFMKNKIDSSYGDLVYVDKDDLNKVVRRWKSGNFNRETFKKGWHPPHPTFFVKRTIYDAFGGFNLKYKIGADYELMLRFLFKHRISTCYIPRVCIKMRVGGRSNRSLRNIIRANIECYRAWKENGLDISPLIILRKPLAKLTQFMA
jgi:glycosyltransferase